MAMRTSRRAARFAAALDAPGRAHDPALAPLVGLAGTLRAVPKPDGPDPAYADRLRTRLVAMAFVASAGAEATRPAAGASAGRSQGAAAASRPRFRLRRPARIAAGLATLAVLLAAVAVAGGKSLPGQPFYAVKQAGEHIQLAFAFGSQSEGFRQLEFARTRLHEVHGLVAAQRSLGPPAGGLEASAASGSAAAAHLVTTTLREMNAETRAGRRDLTAAYRAGNDPSTLRRLARWAVVQHRGLKGVWPDLPAASRGTADAGLTLLSQIRERAHEMLAARGCAKDCSPNPPPDSHQGSRHHEPAATPRPSAPQPSERQPSEPQGHSVAPTPRLHTPKTKPSPLPTKVHTPSRHPILPLRPAHPGSGAPSGGLVPGAPKVRPSAPILPSLPQLPLRRTTSKPTVHLPHR